MRLTRLCTLVSLIFFTCLSVSHVNAQNQSCPASSLSINTIGTITTEVNAKDEITSKFSGDILGIGSLVVVLEGPQCYNGVPYWRISREGVPGWIPETVNNQPIFQPLSNLLPGMALISGTQHVSFNEVAFDINPDVVGKRILAEIGIGSNGPRLYPAHRRFVFVDYAQPPIAFARPLLYIFPVDDYQALGAGIPERLAKLHDILTAQASLPLASDDEPPSFPEFNAGQIYALDQAFVKFQNGIGLRFVTAYSQYPTTGLGDMFYHFTGLTKDGQYVVALTLPVKVIDFPQVVQDKLTQLMGSALLQTPLPDDLKGVTIHDLVEQGVKGRKFEPDLVAIDSMVASINIQAAGPVASNKICAAGAESRFSIGSVGRVINGASRIRASAGLSAQVIGSLPEGEIFTVIGGGVCQNDIVWWQVSASSPNINGWIGEVQGQNYLAEPAQ